MKTKRKIITITEIYTDDDFPTPLKSFYQLLGDRLEKIKQYGCIKDPTVRLDTEREQWEDFYSPILIITYNRPETDSELEKRISANKKAKECRIRENQLQEKMNANSTKTLN